MEVFRIIQPSPLLAPYVKNYWLLKTAGDPAALARTVPTGMMSLIFHRGNRLLSIHDNNLHTRTFQSGQERTFTDLEYTGQVNMISIVFHPVGVRVFFDPPINIIYNRRVTAGDIEDKEPAALEHSLTSTEDDRLCIILIEQFLLRRLCRLAEHTQIRMEAAIRQINSGRTDVARPADTACLGRKQFQRVFSNSHI